MTRQEIIDALESMQKFVICYSRRPLGIAPGGYYDAINLIQRLKDGEEIEAITTPVIWVCPLCKHEHEWRWPISEKPHLNEDIWLVCQGCGKESHMTLTSEGWKWDGDWREVDVL